MTLNEFPRIRFPRDSGRTGAGHEIAKACRLVRDRPAGAGGGDMAVSGATARDDDARALAATIDRLIAARWDENRVAPAPPADDAEFLRRVALDLTGKIPTAGEVRDVPRRPAGRTSGSGWSSACSTSPAYIAHFTNIEMRLLIPEAESSQQAQFLAPAFEAWLREQVAANAGSDQIVRAILTAPVADDARPGAAGRRLRAVPGAVAAAVLRGQGRQEREPRGEHGAAVPRAAAGMRPVPQPSVRLVDPRPVLGLRGVLRQPGEARARGRVPRPDPRAARPPRGGHPRHREGRAGDLPRRQRAAVAVPRSRRG